MTDLIRPTLYEAYHPMRLLRQPAPDAALQTVDVVGPVCETGDYFALGRALPPVSTSDLLAVGMAGAYSAVMASTYNTRPLSPEILVRGDRWSIIRARQTYADLLGADSLPNWN
jgi:diaminopimelate decarboxylase